jgi:hypothetical protein
MDDFDAVVSETARWQRRVDFVLVADQEKRLDIFVGLKRQLCARDDNPATVVAAHDIHCDSHDSF